MKGFKLIALGMSTLLFLSCGGGSSATSKLFNIQLEGNKVEFQQNQTVSVDLRNPKQKSIKSISYSIDGRELSPNDGKITLNIPTLGNKILMAKVSYDEETVEISKNIKILAANSPEIYTYEILNEYPHDIEAYTQGLEFHNDTLYESTGRRGQSSLRKVDYKSGKILKQIDLDKTFFGEGITILNNKIYQLTWQSGIGFIYSLGDFEKIDTFNYDQSKEGWGLCNNGQKLLKSDGTEKIWNLNPESLKEEGYIETVTNTSIFNKTNELEYVNGKIYANVYLKESMMIIDAQSGAIEGVVNLGGLKEKVKQHSDLDVLNGVAYHSGRKTFFVTGKNWDKLFEVNIIKK
ncbi:glutaminyl-peptide cyclotransferase [Sediminicola arcticus]|jgi:glutamine cyclotransferase|uniref:Glutaminyl-peptide cyclotransferase n=1 Tax=Sediminicola arcticus TaxID=1574308 RepID=A0ABV2SV73_9FLAO